MGSTGSAVSTDDNSRSRRSTFAEAIERTADGEPISAIIIGSFGWGDSPDEEQEQITSSAPARIGQLLTWEEARPMLDYEFNASFAAPQCHPIYAWTQRKVLFIQEWDGWTTVLAVPRNPTLVDVKLL